MILFLRNTKNETLVDIECFVKTEDNRDFIELRSVVVIDAYSKFLLENIGDSEEIISVFSDLSELRGWLWERYFVGDDNDPKEYDNVIKILRELLKQIAERFNLYYTED